MDESSGEGGGCAGGSVMGIDEATEEAMEAESESAGMRTWEGSSCSEGRLSVVSLVGSVLAGVLREDGFKTSFSPVDDVLDAAKEMLSDIASSKAFVSMWTACSDGEGSISGGGRCSGGGGGDCSDGVGCSRGCIICFSSNVVLLLPVPRPNVK